MNLDVVTPMVIWTCILAGFCEGFRIPAFLRRTILQTANSAPMAVIGKDDTAGLKADDFLIMPQMMMTMSQITKKLPIEYRPVPLVVGTKQEIDQLRDELQLPVNYPKNTDPKMPEEQIVSMPLTLGQISPIRAPVAANRDVGKAPLMSSKAHPVSSNRSSKVSLDELLPLLRTHPIPTLVHDEPGLILNIMRILAGPKPDGTVALNEPIDKEILPTHMQNLLRLAVRNPQLARTLAKFDPQFIPNLVSAILGIDSTDDSENKQTEDEKIEDNDSQAR